MTHNSPASPRMVALRQALEAGFTSALDMFWNEVGEQGTPLVEAIDDMGTEVLVTFLWDS